MNYIQAIADRISALCHAKKYAQDEQKPAQIRNDTWDDLFRAYAVLCLAKGEGATMEDVHNAWSAWAARYEPWHRSIVPFADLPPEVQELDRPYMEAIHFVARERA